MGEFRFEFWVLSGGEADEITEFPENIKYFLSGDILSEVFKIERLFALFLFVFSRWSADFNRLRISIINFDCLNIGIKQISVNFFIIAYKSVPDFFVIFGDSCDDFGYFTELWEFILDSFFESIYVDIERKVFQIEGSFVDEYLSILGWEESLDCNLVVLESMLGGFETIFGGLFFFVLDIGSVIVLDSLVDFEGLDGSELFEVVIEDLFIQATVDIFDENVGERVSFDLFFVL